MLRSTERSGGGAPVSKRRSIPSRKRSSAASLPTNADQLKLEFALWTREAVATLIQRETSVRLSLSAVGNYLRSWGFTAQRPIRRAKLPLLLQWRAKIPFCRSVHSNRSLARNVEIDHHITLAALASTTCSSRSERTGTPTHRSVYAISRGTQNRLGLSCARETGCLDKDKFIDGYRSVGIENSDQCQLGCGVSPPPA